MDDAEWRDDDFEDSFALANAFRDPKLPVRSFQIKGRKRKRYLEDDEFVKRLHHDKKQNQILLKMQYKTEVQKKFKDSIYEGFRLQGANLRGSHVSHIIMDFAWEFHSYPYLPYQNYQIPKTCTHLFNVLVNEALVKGIEQRNFFPWRYLVMQKTYNLSGWKINRWDRLVFPPNIEELNLFKSNFNGPLGGFKCLKRLDLCDIPKQMDWTKVKFPTTLVYLDLSCTDFDRFEVLSCLKSLRTLKLADVKLRTQHDILPFPPSLHFLDLTRMDLRYVQSKDFSNLVELRELILHGVRVNTWQEVYFPSSIQSIDMYLATPTFGVSWANRRAAEMKHFEKLGLHNIERIRLNFGWHYLSKSFRLIECRTWSSLGALYNGSEDEL